MVLGQEDGSLRENMQAEGIDAHGMPEAPP